MTVTRSMFNAVLFVIAVVLFFLTAHFVANGNKLFAVILVLAASPVAMAATRLAFEPNASVKKMFDPALQSWQFIFGDILGLTLMFYALAWAWSGIDRAPTAWYSQWWWYVLSALVGLAAGNGFHSLDAAGYAKQNASSALLSPTKLCHDYLTFPVILGAATFLVVPLLIGWLGSTPISGAAMATVLVGFVIWAGFGVLDATVHYPKASDMHPLSGTSIRAT